VTLGPGSDPARYRYGAVFLLTLALLVFVIVAPAADWSRAVALLLEGAALVVAVATSRARSDVRRTRAAALTVIGALVVATVAAGLVPVWGTLALGGVLAVAIPLTLVRGLVRLVGTAGATLQAVAGALSIYLLIGLVFAWVIGLVAHVDDAPYFAGGTDGTEGERAYYSLAVLTTTGFGDFTAAQPLGRALAVVEMLVGQLYLVTVIGILIGNLAQRRAGSDATAGDAARGAAGDSA
jgi:Ion channel